MSMTPTISLVLLGAVACGIHAQSIQAGAAIASISVTTSADGASVREGGTLIISWTSENAPDRSAVALIPEKTITGHRFLPIAEGLPSSGSYQWRVPTDRSSADRSCRQDATGGCTGAINPGTTYRIIARLYVGEAVSSGAGTAWLTDAVSGSFRLLPEK